MSKLQKKPAAHKRGHTTLENMKFFKNLFYFCGSFCPPGSGSTDPIESGSNPDPDPKPVSLLVLKVHLKHFSKIKVIKKSKNSRNQGFSNYFCLITEGSGSRRPKNIRILRIRIRNTGLNP